MARRNYYMAGDNYGRAGNYAYQAGGILSSLGKIAGKVAGIASSFIPGGPVVKTVLKAGAGLLGGAAAGRAAVALVPTLRGGPPAPGMIPVPGFGGAVERFLPGGASGFMPGRRRRINPLNVKALRRAGRRIDSFARTARKVLKHTPFMLVSRASRGRRGSPGVITRSEAARALKR